MAGIDRSTRGRLAEEHLEVLLRRLDRRGVRVAGPHGSWSPPRPPHPSSRWCGWAARCGARPSGRRGSGCRSSRCRSTRPSATRTAPRAPSRPASTGSSWRRSARCSCTSPRIPSRRGRRSRPTRCTTCSRTRRGRRATTTTRTTLDVTTADDLRASGVWLVVTPDECVELVRRNGAVALHPLMGGMPPDLGWESLQLFVDEVLPRL